MGLALPWLRIPVVVALSYGLGALGITLLMRAGQVSFGHAMYACIAGYTVAGLARGWPQLDGLVLVAAATVASVATGAVLGLFVTRYRGIFFGMLNLGLSMVLFALIGKLYALTGGTDGLRFERPSLGGLRFDRGQFEVAMMFLSAGASLAMGWAVQQFFRSAAGQVMAGIKTNETRLEYIGISARRALWEGYVLSAGLAGVSGALMVLAQGLVTPENGFWIRSGEYVFVAILGGAAHALGPFLGAAAFEAIKLVASALLTGAWQVLLGLTLIGVIWFAPEGVAGYLARRRGLAPVRRDA